MQRVQLDLKTTKFSRIPTDNALNATWPTSTYRSSRSRSSRAPCKVEVCPSRSVHLLLTALDLYRPLTGTQSSISDQATRGHRRRSRYEGCRRSSSCRGSRPREACRHARDLRRYTRCYRGTRTDGAARRTRRIDSDQGPSPSRFSCRGRSISHRTAYRRRPHLFVE